jgi:chemotaxis protein histidine kinase CheA
MVMTINKNVKIWKEFNPVEFSWDRYRYNSLGSISSLTNCGLNKERIAIKDRWFDVLTPSELFRTRNSDGYYRAIYIQIDMENGEYYIGKTNRPTWSQLKRYQGSGLKFTNKFKKNRHQFVRYFIAACKTAEETERLEASIIDEELLSDDKCLNLVAGGGGTSKHPSIAETSEKKREWMKNHPEQIKPMLEASKKAFRSGDTPELRARSQKTKETMSTEKYREMTRTRLAKWRLEKPNEYAEARRKNLEQIRTPEREAKRKASFEKWVQKNPEKYKAWQERLISSRTSQEVNEKRKTSLKKWRDKNPQQAQENAQKRAKAAAEKRSKAVQMFNLQSGETLRVFPSQHAAARWLMEIGKAKNTNCVSSISSVCLRKPCTTGYGFHKKAYGYGWRFVEEKSDKADVLI